jgi:hypothetical protein
MPDKVIITTADGEEITVQDANQWLFEDGRLLIYGERGDGYGYSNNSVRTLLMSLENGTWVRVRRNGV